MGNLTNVLEAVGGGRGGGGEGEGEEGIRKG